LWRVKTVTEKRSDMTDLHGSESDEKVVFRHIHYLYVLTLVGLTPT